jgi:hypothetical protein
MATDDAFPKQVRKAAALHTAFLVMFHRENARF